MGLSLVAQTPDHVLWNTGPPRGFPKAGTIVGLFAICPVFHVTILVDFRGTPEALGYCDSHPGTGLEFSKGILEREDAAFAWLTTVTFVLCPARRVQPDALGAPRTLAPLASFSLCGAICLSIDNPSLGWTPYIDVPIR